MDILAFEDDELDILFEAINNLQIIYHPRYAPCGKFTIDTIFELEKKEVIIFIDNNILSPIYEIITTGTLRDKLQLAKISAFILFTRYIRAQITCGLALFENDTAQKSSIPAEDKRQSFLFGVDKVSSIVWKRLAFGDIETIPSVFLSTFSIESNTKNYKNSNELHYIMHQVAIMRLLHFLKDNILDGFSRFILFFEWYADNLMLAESMVVYAALLFGNTDHVAAPKNYNSNDFEKVLNGINNQAWDMFYISHWSTYYYTEEKDSVYMFATDDITQKMIIANNEPEEFPSLVATVFSSKKQKQKLLELFNSKLGENRVNPLKNKSKKEKIEYITQLYKITEKAFKDKYFET